MIKRIFTAIIAIVFLGLFAIQYFLPKDMVYGKEGFLKSTAIALDFLNSPFKSSETTLIPSGNMQIETEGDEVKGILNANDQKYKFEVLKTNPTKIEGVSEYKLKFSKKNYFERGRYLNVFPVMEALSGPAISNLVAEKLKLVHAPYKMMELDCNGDKNLYYFRESISKDLTEKQSVSNGIIFKLKLGKNKIKAKKIAEDNPNAPAFITNKLNLLDLVIDTNAVVVAKDFFDLDYMARYYVYQHLMGNIENDGNYWYYRLTNAKFYPVAYHNKNIKNLKKKQKSVSKDRIWKYLFQVPDFTEKVDAYKSKINQEVVTSFLKPAKALKALLSNQKSNYSQGELNWLLEETENRLLANHAKLKESYVPDEVTQFSIDFNIIQDSTSFLASLIYPDLIKHLEALGVKVEGDNMIFDGKFNIDRTTIIPANYNVTIMAGTEIKMGHKVSLLSYSTMQMNGTEEAPIKIYGDPGSPFGLFGIIGDESNTSNLSFVDVSHGSEDYVNGIYMSGALNIYHENANLQNVIVHNNHADDGLNIKYGKINVMDCKFAKNYADQVDLDFCSGKVTGTAFSNNEGDSNGDGLDFSGSFILVEKCSFEKFDDKGISVGENTKAVIKDCSFFENNLGMAIKDLSEITVTNCVFRNNGVAFSLYMKKGIFGGSTLHNCGNDIDQEPIFKADSLSTIDEDCTTANLTLYEI